ASPGGAAAPRGAAGLPARARDDPGGDRAGRPSPSATWIGTVFSLLRRPRHDRGSGPGSARSRRPIRPSAGSVPALRRFPAPPAPHKDDRAILGPSLGGLGSAGPREGAAADGRLAGPAGRPLRLAPRSAGVSQGGSAVRWVRRAEAGGFKVEYAAIVLLTATLVIAVFSFGLPTETQRLYAVGLCRIKGEDNCEELSGDENGPVSEAGGDGGGGGTDDPGSGDGESPAPEESGSPSPGGE